MIILILLIILTLILIFIFSKLSFKQKNSNDEIYSLIENHVKTRNPYLENKIEKVLDIKIKQENYLNKLTKEA